MRLKRRGNPHAQRVRKGDGRPTLATPRTQTCQGVIVHTDPRLPPLVACREHVDDGARFCKDHAHESDRQLALLKYLKKGWKTGLVGKRGRPRKDERPKPPSRPNTGPLPKLPNRVPPPKSAEPATTGRENSQAPRSGRALPTPEEAWGQFARKLPKLPD